MNKLILKSNNHDQLVENVVDSLNSNGVVLLPTETVYGLMTRYANEAGKERIIQIKNRPESKLFQMLISSLKQAEEAGAVFDERADKLAKKFWPGAMTLVVPGKNGGTIGLRLPNHKFVCDVIDKLGKPLAATSANLSGLPPVKELSEIDNYFVNGQPDLVIDEGERVDNTASTVVSLCDDGVKILREGIITEAEILNCLQS